MVSVSALLAAAATVALAAIAPTPVDAHGVLLKPKAQYGGKNGNSPVAKLESASVLPPLAGMSYRKTPESNTEAFTAAFQAANYTSLRQFLTAKLPSDVDPKCGISQLGEPQPLPEKVEFGFRPGEGFVENHHGPCEIWCDDTRVMADANCARNLNVELGKGPVKLAYDKAKCAGAKVLSFTWLAVHLSRWEVYVYCAAVDGSASSGGDSNSNGSTARPVITPSPRPPVSLRPTPRPSVDDGKTRAPTAAPTPHSTQKPTESPATRTPAPSEAPSADADSDATKPPSSAPPTPTPTPRPSKSCGVRRSAE
ncbi:hypothetical protein P43SY_010669 [Pythium insidiosum]|uniref:Uncharacterized protein n=1 Tax=Pythium insidiosum TaxID=114742 RepID=A0AAD5LRW5_PYTIN|nr:hypothetical protein P43SY_010669 [Pythium insidiosum]